MEGFIQIIRKHLASSLSKENINSLKQTIQLHKSQLQNFQFSFDNPVFGILILLAFLILSRIWGLKKAFSYCLLVSVLLYLTSRVITYFNIEITEGLGVTYADTGKGLAVFIIIIVTIYYAVIRSE